MTFRDEQRELQELVRELFLLRDHNLRVARQGSDRELLLFAEGSLVLLVLERFLRVILKGEAHDHMTLQNLLEISTSERVGLLVLPARDRADAIRRITSVRNTLQHANYEQAAREAGCSSAADYFRSSQFIGEIERLFELVDHLFRQIDPSTGRRGGP